jgi:mono/diheme cytochrome c family protein
MGAGRTCRELGRGGLAAVLLATIAAISPSAGAAPRNSAAIAQGRADALGICAVCHVVAANQRDAPFLRQPTPSFQAIANDPKWTFKTLSRFLATTHWDENTTPMKMSHYPLPDHEMDDVVLYILSLRAQPAPAGVQAPSPPPAGAARDH